MQDDAERVPGAVVRVGMRLALAAIVTGAACSAVAPTPAPASSLRPVYDPATGRLTELSLDADGDARFEFKAHVVGRSIQRVDVDADGDGVPERREHYDAVPAATGGQLEPRVRVVEQFDPMGSVTRREGYEGEQLAWVQEDRDRDGRMDRWETWSAGALTSVTIARKAPGANLRIVYPATPRQHQPASVEPAD